MTRDPLTDEELREIRDRIEAIEAATDRLRELGADVPAIERNAARIQGTLGMLDAEVPPELVETDDGD